MLFFCWNHFSPSLSSYIMSPLKKIWLILLLKFSILRQYWSINALYLGTNVKFQCEKNGISFVLYLCMQSFFIFEIEWKKKFACNIIKIYITLQVNGAVTVRFHSQCDTIKQHYVFNVCEMMCVTSVHISSVIQNDERKTEWLFRDKEHFSFLIESKLCICGKK